MDKNRSGLALGAVLLVAGGVALLPSVALIRRSWPFRVTVDGHSMEPSVRAGDWLLVDPDAYAGRLPQVGDLVVARDPGLPSRWLAKRVHDVLPDGSLLLAGDHPGHAGDDVLIGPVDVSAVIGRPWFRYRPLDRAGRIG